VWGNVQIAVSGEFLVLGLKGDFEHLLSTLSKSLPAVTAKSARLGYPLYHQ
jgi:hypothetical protein